MEAEAEEQPAAELNSTATTGLQPQAEAQAAESRDHEAAAGVTIQPEL